MSGEMREKDQADFDMDRFIDMFDEALTSRDPRVIETLRSLLMITTLTRPEPYSGPAIDRQHGPLRRMAEDVRQAHRRISDLEDMVQMILRNQSMKSQWEMEDPHEKYATQIMAAQMAAEVDQDVINQIKIKAKGLYEK